MHETAPPARMPRRHLVLAVLLVLVGLFVLSHTIVATRVSVLVIGWSSLAAAALAALVILTHIGRPPFWLVAFSGVVSSTLGVVILSDPRAAAETMTLIAGALFLALGALRVVMPVDNRRSRALLVVSVSHLQSIFEPRPSSSGRPHDSISCDPSLTLHLLP